VRKSLAVAIATFGGVGFFPVASGTVGAAACLALYALIVLAGVSGGALIALQIGGAALLLAIGVWACGETEARFGKDGGEMVVDEALGMLISVALVPPRLAHLAAAFLLFRLFDIVKPWPAGRCERIHGGWGVMLDDLVAGIYANLVLRLGMAAWAAFGSAGTASHGA
jgi:phosphatidylglycerophosphatase A